MNFLPYKYTAKHPFPVSRVHKKYQILYKENDDLPLSGGMQGLLLEAYSKEHARSIFEKLRPNVSIVSIRRWKQMH